MEMLRLSSHTQNPYWQGRATTDEQQSMMFFKTTLLHVLSTRLTVLRYGKQLTFHNFFPSLIDCICCVFENIIACGAWWQCTKMVIPSDQNNSFTWSAVSLVQRQSNETQYKWVHKIGTAQMLHVKSNENWNGKLNKNFGCAKTICAFPFSKFCDWTVELQTYVKSKQTLRASHFIVRLLILPYPSKLWADPQ